MRRPLDPETPALQEIQGSLVHVIAVTRDLSWYEHLHASERERSAFELDITFPREDEYILYTYFKPHDELQRRHALRLYAIGLVQEAH